jgi:hypothetical protein
MYPQSPEWQHGGSVKKIGAPIVESRSAYSGETGFSKNPSGMFMINPRIIKE